MMVTYVATKGFNYPKDLVVRDAIRSWHNNNRGQTYDQDRGEQVEVTAGSVIVDPPVDLLESWLVANLVKVVE